MFHLPQIDLSINFQWPSLTKPLTKKVFQVSLAAATACTAGALVSKENSFTRTTFTVLGSLAILSSAVSRYCLIKLENQVQAQNLKDVPQQAIQNKTLANKLKDKKIVVFTRQNGGFGDLSCAKKTCILLHDRLGVRWENMALACTNNGLFSPHQKVTFINPDYKSLRDWGRDLQIMVSDLADQCGQVPTLLINEYGYKPLDTYNKKNIRSYAFGLDKSKNELGIVINPALRDWSYSPESMSSLGRLQQLANVLPNLQSAILGSDYSIPVISKFAANNRFYFGYACNFTESLTFMAAVTRMNYAIGNHSDLTFFMMECTRGYYEGGSSKYFKDVFKNGEVGIYECIGWDENKVLVRSETVINPKSKTKLRFITGRIDSQYVPFLEMASESETLGTGDQSFSEKASCGKYCVYERLDHKEPHYRSYSSLFPPALQDLMRFYDNEKHLDLDKLTNFLITKKKSPEITSFLNERMKQIARDYDFAPQFENVLEKLVDETIDIKEPPLGYIKSLDLSKEKITSELIPFDQWIHCEEYSIVELRINRSGLSELPQFQDSFFEYTKADTDSYLVIRRRK